MKDCHGVKLFINEVETHDCFELVSSFNVLESLETIGDKESNPGPPTMFKVMSKLNQW